MISPTPLLDWNDLSIKTLPGFPAVWSGAGPKDSLYRYVLWWITGVGDPLNFMAAIGCNPSTATELKTDPTVLRWIRWARQWGFEAVAVLNRYALRSTDPRAILTAVDPEGPANLEWVLRVGREAKFALASWGDIGAREDDKFQCVWDAAGCPPFHCVATTASGAPRHPLARGKHRIPDQAKPVAWRAVSRC